VRCLAMEHRDHEQEVLIPGNARPPPEESSRTGCTEKTRIRLFTAYTFFKYVTAATVLLIVAISRKATIEEHYNKNTCDRCLSAASKHPDTFYEFGPCTRYHSSMGHPNLMAYGSENLASSSVSSYVWGAGMVLAVVLMFCALVLQRAFPFLCCERSDTWRGVLVDVLLTLLSFVCVFLLMVTANSVFQLYAQPDGNADCYVSAWGKNFLMASQIMMYVVVACWLGLVVASWLFVGTNSPWVYYFYFGLFMCLVAYTLFSMVLGVVNFQVSGDKWHVAFNGLMLLTLLEIPYCLYEPRIREQYVSLGRAPDCY